MRIATRLRIAALVPFLMAGMVIVALAANRTALVELQDDETHAVQISTGLNELNELARTYVVGHEQRPKLQFEAAHRDVTRLIERSHMQPEYASTMRFIATDVSFVGSLFDRIVSNHAKHETSPSADAAEAEQRLAGQLFLRSRRANATASELVVTLGQRMVDRQQLTYAWGAGIATLAAFVLAIGLLTLTRSINDSIGKLSDGTEVVGAGDLDHRIVLGVDDEMSDLARSFNRMTARLQAVTVSTERLSEEVERRTRTARELDAERSQLDAVLRNMSEAVQVWGPNGCPVRVNEAALAMLGVADTDEMVRALSDPEDVIVRTVEGRLVPRDEWPVPRVLRGDAYSNEVLDVSVSSTGTRFIGSHSGIPIRGENDELLMGVVTIHDITDIHEAQERERQELRTTQTLLEVARAVSTWTEIDPLLRNVAELVLRSGTAQRVSIGLVDPEYQEVRIAAIAGGDETPSSLSVRTADLPDELGELLRTGVPAVVDYDSVPEHQRRIAPKDSRLVLHVPVVYGDTPIGWIAVDDPARRHHARPREIGVIEAIASQTAVAIENARRYKAEHDIAERLQTALLDLPSTVNGISFATLYRSASMSARVGGDFYDIFEIDGRLIGVTVGDVAGKGLNAAALTSVVKNAIRAHATDATKTPAQVLELTNDLLFRATPPESFVTVWFGVIDRQDRTLVYANAGHPAALVVHRDGRIDRAGSTAPVLGAVPEIRSEPGEVLRLEPDALLFIHTDGLTEARCEEEMFGDQRVAELVSSLAGETTDEVVHRVEAAALEFTGGRLLDDLAIMSVRLE